MSDLGEMRLKDVYGGLKGSSAAGIHEETVLDSQDKFNMGMAAEKTYTDKNNVTRVVSSTEKNKLMAGLVAFVGLIVIIGLIK